MLNTKAIQGPSNIDTFIAVWRDTGGSELANTQSFINGPCHILGIDAIAGSRADDAHNDYYLISLITTGEPNRDIRLT